MSHFEDIPGKNLDRLITYIPEETYQLAGDIGIVEGINKTTALNRIIGCHALRADIVGAGGLIVTTDGKKVEPFEPEFVADDDLRAVKALSIEITPKHKKHVINFMSDDNPRDLVGFWLSAGRYFNSWSTKQLAGHQVCVVQPDMSVTRIHYLHALLDDTSSAGVEIRKWLEDND